MKFVDEAVIEVSGGHGGAGCVSFLREKFRPKGGPDGGNGGAGGSVVLVADPNLTTLLDFKYKPRLAAGRGEHGRGKEQHGRAGDDAVAHVPAGTLVRDADSGESIADLATPGERVVVARGGRGGRGNATYKSATNQAPRRSQPGEEGEARRLRLELHLLADVGLVGFPNAGKSTLLGRVSAARPRVADYPFTTLVPHLGVVRVDEEAHFVLADIPGLIEGAHAGHGLGDRFLRHVSRAHLLLHLLDASGASGRDPLADFDAINRELELFDPALAAYPQIVAANKIDVATPEFIDELRRRFAARDIELWCVSAATGANLRPLMAENFRRLQAHRAQTTAERNRRVADLPPIVSS